MRFRSLKATEYQKALWTGSTAIALSFHKLDRSRTEFLGYTFESRVTHSGGYPRAQSGCNPESLFQVESQNIDACGILLSQLLLVLLPMRLG